MFMIKKKVLNEYLCQREYPACWGMKEFGLKYATLAEAYAAVKDWPWAINNCEIELQKPLKP